MASTFTSNLGKILENLNRTSYGSNEAIRNIIESAKGEEEFTPAESFKKGFTLETKTTGGEILNSIIGEASAEAGIPEKVMRGVLGFGVDVFADPLTYVGIGGLTKVGKLSKFATGQRIAGKVISPTSKIGQSLSKLAPETLKFGETWAEQGAKGQRAILEMFGKSLLPKFADEAMLGLVSKTAKWAGKMPLIKGAKNLFVFKSGNTKFDNLVNTFSGEMNKAAEKYVDRIKAINKKAIKFKVEDWDKVRTEMQRPAGLGGLHGEVAKDLKDIFKDMAKIEVDSQTLKGTIDNYFPGVPTEDFANFMRSVHKRGGEKGASEFETTLNYAKEKLLTKEMTISQANETMNKILGSTVKIKDIQDGIVETLSDASKASLQEIQDVAQSLGVKEFKKGAFVTDPLTAAMSRSLASVKAIESKKFIETVAKDFGMDKTAWDKLPIQLTERFGKTKSDFRTIKGIPEFEGKYFDNRVADSIERYHGAMTNFNEINSVVKGYKGLINFWKRWTLSIFPEYHTRNLIGNFWNNYITIGLKSPLRYQQAGALQMKPQNYRLMTDAGEELTGTQILDEMKSYGVLKSGAVSKEVPEKASDLYKGVTLNPASERNVLIKGGRAVGETLEDNGKIAHYLEVRKQGLSPADSAMSVKAALFDYCFDKETEILTNKGWRKYNEISKEEMALTFNIQKDCLEWTAIDSVYINNNYSGNMHHLKSSTFNACVTPNHKFVTIGGVNGGHHTIKKDKYRLQEVLDIAPSGILKVDCSEYNYHTEIYSDDFIKLVAWVLTEGSYAVVGNSIQVYQSEINYKKIEEIRIIFDKFKLNNTINEYIFKRTPPIHSFYICGETSKLIRSMFPGKVLTMDFVVSLSQRQAKMFLDEMIKGDGTIDKKSKRRSFAQKNRKFVDAFTALTFLTGYRSGVCKGKTGCHTISVYQATNQRSEWKALKKEVKHYDGTVWCITTKNSTLVARRGDKIYISGNSQVTPFEREVMRFVFPFWGWTRNNVPLQLKSLLSKPGKFTTIAKAKEEVEQAQGTEDIRMKWMPEWMQESFPIILSKMPAKEQYKVLLLTAWLPAGDIDKLFRPQEMLLGSLEPISKETMQLIAGKDFYLDKNIVDYPGEVENMLGLDMSPKVKHALKQIRLLNTIDQVNPAGVFGNEELKRKSWAGGTRTITDMTAKEKAAKYLGGVKLYPYDVEKGEKFGKAKITGEISKLKYQVKKEEKKGNYEKVARIMKAISDLEEKKKD